VKISEHVVRRYRELEAALDRVVVPAALPGRVDGFEGLEAIRGLGLRDCRNGLLAEKDGEQRDTATSTPRSS
jgi:hypothetical protein